METKSSIRKRILALRNAISTEELLKMSEAICQRVLRIPVVQTADVVLCYAGYKSEVMTDTLMHELLKQGKKVYLPKVTGDEMDFYRIHNMSDLAEGFMNIPEPAEHCKELFSQSEDSKVVMILPGCAFSKKGTRIGYGKGYYDRYLKRIPCNERIALCYELQLVARIMADEHDIPVTQLVTEQQIIQV